MIVDSKSIFEMSCVFVVTFVVCIIVLYCRPIVLHDVCAFCR